MDIGDNVLLSGINLPEGVEIPALAQGEDRDQAVVSVTEAREIVIEEEVEEVALEGEEGEEGEVAEGEAAEGEDSSEKPKEGGEEASEKGEDTKEG